MALDRVVMPCTPAYTMAVPPAGAICHRACDPYLPSLWQGWFLICRLLTCSQSASLHYHLVGLHHACSITVQFNRVMLDMVSGASTTPGSLTQQGTVSGVKEHAFAPTGAQTPDQANEHFSMDRGSHR